MSYMHHYLIDLSFHKLESKKHFQALLPIVLIRNALQTQQDTAEALQAAHTAAHDLDFYLEQLPDDTTDDNDDLVMEDEWGDAMLRSAILRAGIIPSRHVPKQCRQASTLLSMQPRKLSQSLAN